MLALRAKSEIANECELPGTDSLKCVKLRGTPGARDLRDRAFPELVSSALDESLLLRTALVLQAATGVCTGLPSLGTCLLAATVEIISDVAYYWEDLVCEGGVSGILKNMQK